MTIIQALPLLVLLADPNSGWEEVSKGDGITTYARAKEGSNVREVKSMGLIDAPADKVVAVIKDLNNYKKFMPYTEESKVLSTEQDGKVNVFYSVVNAPFVDKRDYVIRIVDESDWKGGQGFMRIAWKAASHPDAPEKSGLVRVKVNDGYWMLEPRENGQKTFVTYYLYLDSGGSIPNWLVNKANSTSVPDVFKAVRKKATGK